MTPLAICCRAVRRDTIPDAVDHPLVGVALLGKLVHQRNVIR
jgi:hypothetical protein